MLTRASLSLASILAACFLAASFSRSVRGETTDLSTPTAAGDYLQSAQELSRQGRSVQSLTELSEGLKAFPDDPYLTAEVEKEVSAGLPSDLPEDLLAELPITTKVLSDDLGIIIIPNDYLPTTSLEPQKGWQFAKVCYLYQNAPLVPNRIALFCRVHYVSVDDTALAGRIARLTALAHEILVRRTGEDAANAHDPFDIWVCRRGKTGGEQWRSNIYFYDTDAPRSSIEWIREIIHEYSHLALPPIGGYKMPEYWASGYLGERLIVRWLERTPGGTALVERAWGDFSGASNFNRLLISPALDSYRRIGPNPKWLVRTDEAGMRYFIGEVLALDDSEGSRNIGRAFRRLPMYREDRPADLISALVSLGPQKTALTRK